MTKKHLALLPVLAVLVAICAFTASARAEASHSHVPTLGVAAEHGEGFGRIRPSTIGFVGDGTSGVAKVKWTSWGGPKAVGQGVAEWVWPGWCEACGAVELKATAVAYDLTGSCGGHPGYARFEWYFPGRGEHFTVKHDFAYYGNVCKPKNLPTPPAPKLITCPQVKIPGGVAGQISGYYFSCVAFDRMLAKAGVMRHYGRNARFHSGAWWLGSELSMNYSKRPWQDFSASMGNFADVSFAVKPVR